MTFALEICLVLFVWVGVNGSRVVIMNELKFWTSEGGFV